MKAFINEIIFMTAIVLWISTLNFNHLSKMQIVTFIVGVIFFVFFATRLIIGIKNSKAEK